MSARSSRKRSELGAGRAEALVGRLVLLVWLGGERAHLESPSSSGRKERAPGRCQASANDGAAGCQAALERGLHRRVPSLRDSSVQAHDAVDERAARDPASRPVRGSRGRDARGRGRLEASSLAGDARAPAGPRGRRRRARRRPVGRGAPGRSAERAPPPHRPPARRARRGVDRRLGRRVRAEGRARRRGAVRGAARGDARRAARRRRPCRGGRRRVGAGALARAGAAGPDRHDVVQRRGAAARGAARRRARGAVRGRRSRSASIASSRRRSGRRSPTTRSASGCGGS